MVKGSTVEAVLARIPSVGSKVLSLFSGLLSASLILYSSLVLYDTFYTQSKAFASEWDLLQYRPEIVDDNVQPVSGADTLASINEDYRAWLTVKETNIDYPVMQGKDDLYYAFHDVHKQSSISGSIYMAAANKADMSDPYIVIYGHHMDNKAMFGGLDDYVERKYYDAHKTGVLVTKNKIYDLTAFAVLKTDAYEGAVYNVSGKTVSDIRSFLESANDPEAGSHTIIYDKAVADKADKVAALSTCAGATTNGRLVVFMSMKLRTKPDPKPDDDDDDDGGGGGGGGGGRHGYTGGDTPEIGPGVNPTQEPGTPMIPADAGGGPGTGGGTGGTGTGTGGSGSTDGTGGSGTSGDGTGGDISGGGAGGASGGAGGEAISDGGTPSGVPAAIGRFMQRFIPAGGISMNQMKCWALLNLICTIVTLYILLPLTHINGKFKRAGLLKRINKSEKELERLAILNSDPKAGNSVIADFIDGFKHQTQKFMRKFRLGIILEIALGAVAVILFLIFQDMKEPMVFIDQFTPAFLALTLVTWLVDVKLVRFKTESLRKEAEALEAELEAKKAATS